MRIQRQLLQELGREPNPEEIGKEMGLPAERVREIQKISQEPVSLETVSYTHLDVYKRQWLWWILASQTGSQASTLS